MMKKKKQEEIKISVYNPFRDVFSEVSVEYDKKFVKIARQVEEKLKELGIEVE